MLADAQPVLEAISNTDLAEDFAEDIPFLLEDRFRVSGAPPLGSPERNPVLEGYAEKVRVISRSAKIVIYLRKVEGAIHKIDGHAGYKAAGILATLTALISLGIGLL